MIPTFIGVSLITFVIIQLAPGSPIAAKLMFSENGMSTDAASQKIMEDTKRLYGLDKPIPVQYGLWLGRLVTLDFGKSYKDQRPVLDKIAEALPITIQLSLLSIFLAYLIALPAGIFSATRQYSLIDSGLTLTLFILYSLPSFWVATLLIMFFAGGEYYNWFPAHGISSIEAKTMTMWDWTMDRLWHMALPLFCYTYGSLAMISRYMRGSMLETIRQDYIRTARAFGFSERVVVYRYALRNSLIPIVTLLGGLLPALIGGSVIIESIFSIPGMGRLAFEGVLSRDYPLVMGVFAISALLTMFGLLLSDILTAIVNPKITFD